MPALTDKPAPHTLHQTPQKWVHQAEASLTSTSLTCRNLALQSASMQQWSVKTTDRLALTNCLVCNKNCTSQVHVTDLAHSTQAVCCHHHVHPGRAEAHLPVQST